MKLKKMLAQVEEFLDADKRKRKEEYIHMKHVLKKLRDYEDEVCKKLKSESDPEKVEKLERKMNLAHQQRKRGIEILKALKAEKQPPQE